jgi:hypothetical protein
VRHTSERLCTSAVARRRQLQLSYADVLAERRSKYRAKSSELHHPAMAPVRTYKSCSLCALHFPADSLTATVSLKVSAFHFLCVGALACIQLQGSASVSCVCT